MSIRKSGAWSSGLLSALVACLALCVSAPAQSSETRKQFETWSALCSGETYCTASARVRTRDAGQPYAFQLRVSRFKSKEGLEIALLSARERPPADAPITVEIDDREIITLPPGSGYSAVAGGGTYVVTDRAATVRMLAAMRSGTRMELRFPSAQGKNVSATFPLRGFAPALAFIAGKQPLPAQGWRSYRTNRQRPPRRVSRD